MFMNILFCCNILWKWNFLIFRSCHLRPFYIMCFTYMGKLLSNKNIICVVVIPWTLLPQRNRRCALSAAGMWKSEEKEARGVTCFMEENEINRREVVRFDEDKRLSLKWKTAAFFWYLIGAHPSVHFAS